MDDKSGDNSECLAAGVISREEAEVTRSFGNMCRALPCPGEVNLHMDLEGGIGVYLKEKSIVGRKNT